MKTLRILIFMLALLEAGWIAFDGARALATGDYLKPRIGAYGGKLGPWTRLAWAAGTSPHSQRVKALVMGFGLLWLVAAVAFVRGAGGAWWPMMIAAVGALWYSSLVLPLSLAQMLLLIAGRRDL